MTDAVAISIVTGVASVVACVMGVVNSVVATRAAVHIADTRAAMEHLEKNTNSMKDALVKVTGEAEFAKGVKEGQEGVPQICDSCPLTTCPLRNSAVCPLAKK